MEERPITDYGLVGPTTDGILWFRTAEGVAEAWASGEYPDSTLRLSRNGEVINGSPAEVKPVYDHLATLREGS